MVINVSFCGWHLQCALADHKLYKREGGKDDFHFLSLRCMHLLQNAPRLESSPSRIAQITLPDLQEGIIACQKRTTEEWKAMKSEIKRCRVYL